MIRSLLLLSITIGTSMSFAQGIGGSRALRSNYKNVQDTKGLCTMDNKEEEFFEMGNCQSLKEQLSADKCTADLLEKLRKKMVAQADGNSNLPPNQQFNAGSLEACESRHQGTTWDKIIRNKAVFGTVMMQFFMAVAIAESNEDTFNGLSKAAGVNINHGPTGGQMNLSTDKMEEAKYNKDKCGCTNTNSKEAEVAAFFFWRMLVGPNANAAMTVKGRSPGPRDDHHSLQCGAYIALVEASEDGVLFQGQRKQTATSAGPNPASNDNKPKGAAKIYKSLQDWEDQPNAPYDPERLANNPDLNFILKKMKTYCHKYLNENGGMTRTMDDDFPAGGTNLRSTR